MKQQERDPFSSVTDLANALNTIKHASGNLLLTKVLAKAMKDAAAHNQDIADVTKTAGITGPNQEDLENSSER